jgi:hypothetical protein
MSSKQIVTGTFTGTGASNPVYVNSYGSFELNFGTGTVQLERSLDEKATWVAVPNGEFTADVSTVISDPYGAYYRLNCTAYTGDIAYHIESDNGKKFVG